MKHVEVEAVVRNDALIVATAHAHPVTGGLPGEVVAASTHVALSLA